MKILLLKPINDRYDVVQPPLGLGYLAAVIAGLGHRAEIVDAGRVNLTWKGFADLIDRGNYDLVGIQMFSHEVAAVKKHLGIVKKVSPRTVTLVGGPHISGDPKGTVESLDTMDYGFVGEAEIGLEGFLRMEKRDYTRFSRLRVIPNPVCRDDGQISVNPRPPVPDPDVIAPPAWHLIDPRSYPPAAHGIFYRYFPAAPLITSRGCPFQCTFCAARAITGPVIRYRSVNNVIEEIALLHERHGVREFHIEDDNFTLRPDYVIDFCRRVEGLGSDLAFALPNGIRLDTLNREILIRLEKAGFYSVAVGIESGSDRILKLMKKKLTRSAIWEKLHLIRETTNMRISGFFLMGYPGETEDEIVETIDFARKLPLDLASFLIVMPLPGSSLWNEYKERHYDKIKWENFIPSRISFGLSNIPPLRLKRLQRWATLSFYLRPRIISGILRELKRPRQYGIIARRLGDIFR